MSEARAKQLGNYIEDARKKRGLTLRAVSEEAEMAASALFRLERGEYHSPDPQKLVRLARVLEIPVEDLFALAGYTMPEGLPEFAPYLRAKYELTPKEIAELNAVFAKLAAKKKGGRRGPDRR